MEKNELESINIKNLIILRRTFSYLKPFIGLQFFILIITLISTSLSLSLPLFMKMLIDDVIIKQKIYFLGRILTILTAILFSQIFLSILHSYLTTILSNKIAFNTNKEIYNHLLKLPLGYFSKYSAGETMSKMMNDINSLQNIAQNFFLSFLFDTFSIIVILSILFYFHSSLAIISLIAFPLFALSPKIFGKGLYKESKLIQEKLAIITKFINESISGISIIKSFVKEKSFLERYKKLWKDYLDFTLRRAVKKTFATEVVRILTFIGPLTVLGYGGWLTYKNELSVGALVAFYSYLIKLYSPVSSLINSQLNLHIAAAGIKRIFDFLDEKTEGNIEIVENEKLINEEMVKRGSIKFIDVEFKFEDRNFALSDISFVVEAGSSIGFVGLSGSGKTTIVNLLCRYYPLSKGRIEIDSHDIRKIPISLLRKEIAVVPQEPFIFNATILDNFSFVKEDATIDEIEEVCKIAQIHDFILSLPHGYKTVVGDRGFTLSTGQKQRIAIAMALLKKSKIFVLDEATSAIDSITETRLLDSLFSELKGKTVIVIAHRLSNLKYVDNIVVLEKGKIVEKGSKRDLMKKESLLRSYFEHQYKHYLNRNLRNYFYED